MDAARDYACGQQLGDLYCWGTNSLGQLDNPAAGAFSPTPVAVLEDVQSIYTGATFACANIFETYALWCWGSNDAGQLGDGSTTAASSPVAVVHRGSPLSAPQASTGASHACARTQSNQLLCWGSNEYAQLGIGGAADRDPHPVPAQVSDPEGASEALWQLVSAGTYTSCAMLVNGSLYCWGRGDLGTLCTGQLADSVVPVLTLLPALAQFSVRGSTGCAVLASYELVCWGDNADRQVGVESYAELVAPRPLAVMPNAKIVDTTVGSTCAVSLDFELFCWGNNEYGELGLGGASDPVPTPTLVPSPEGLVWTSVAIADRAGYGEAVST
ncbi:hypothetical protein H632_c2825p0 [Helicosporidium sp. ATCC 50920]|nr:hypothetical protein H632_c2825p0 [Helicosporidium sp. ATCC 50920]|eukprot:KDD72841.1 hypothetical protein H632_c2825p0 [Helicosporidium sp. ATCC 50920]